MPFVQFSPLLDKGPYIKDVRTGRGEGGSPKADVVREFAWIYSYRSSQNADKGGGVQNPKNFAEVLYVWSLMAYGMSDRLENWSFPSLYDCEENSGLFSGET